MKSTRNNSLVDKWSIMHLLSSAGLTILIGPVAAFVITTLWEPVELLLISPLLAKQGVTFGKEAIRNSMSDLVFNTIGIVITLAGLSLLGLNAGVLMEG